MYTYICLFIYFLDIYLFIYLFSFIHLFICSFIYLFIYLFICVYLYNNMLINHVFRTIGIWTAIHPTSNVAAVYMSIPSGSQTWLAGRFPI